MINSKCLKPYKPVHLGTHRPDLAQTSAHLQVVVGLSSRPSRRSDLQFAGLRPPRPGPSIPAGRAVLPSSDRSQTHPMLQCTAGAQTNETRGFSGGSQGRSERPRRAARCRPAAHS